MSFREMLDMLLDLIGHRDNAEMEKRARIWLNATHRNWCADGRVSTDSTLYAFTIAAAASLITDVPADFLTAVNLRILSKGSSLDTQYKGGLQEVTPQELDEAVPNRAAESTGTPRLFTFRRTSHPKETGDGTTLNIVSTATAAQGDNTQKVSVVGYSGTDRSRPIEQEFTLDGTTSVSVTTPVATLISFSKSADTVGYVQLKDGSGAVLAELMPWQRSHHLPVLEVYQWVDDQYQMELRYNRRPMPMTKDASVPLYIDDQFHAGLVYGAAAEYAMDFTDDSRVASIQSGAARHWQRFQVSRRRQDVTSGGFQWGHRRHTLSLNPVRWGV